MFADIKIGAMVYGISRQAGAWSEFEPYEGRIVSFDETTTVLWGYPANHDTPDMDNDPYQTGAMIFCGIGDACFFDEDERDRELDRLRKG